jgi:hypothetical protein
MKVGFQGVGASGGRGFRGSGFQGVEVQGVGVQGVGVQGVGVQGVGVQGVGVQGVGVQGVGVQGVGVSGGRSFSSDKKTTIPSGVLTPEASLLFFLQIVKTQSTPPARVMCAPSHRIQTRRSNFLRQDGRAGFQPRRTSSLPSGVLTPEARVGILQRTAKL